MAEQHSQTEDYESPYKFNGKELDAETGYYYYGARYYDPKVSIWLSVDPLGGKFSHVNPYAYCVQNPINFVDPDGMAPKWKTDRQGNLIAEKGDNTASLAKYLNRSVSDVAKNFKKEGQSIGANHNFKIGEKVDLNNNMTAAIDKSKGVTAYEHYIESKPLKRDVKNDCYMCQESVMTGSRGDAIGNTNTSTFSKEFQEFDSFDDLSFGEGAVLIKMKSGDEHFMLPYGKSQEGIPSVFSKEGTIFKPGVYPLGEIGGDTSKPTAVNFQRAINNSEVEEIKYYKYVGNN